jgi:hypothetical protein
VGGDGVDIRGGGLVTNGASGSASAVISGVNGVQNIGGGAVTVVNFATIIGTGDAVLLRTASDRLIAEAGSAFTGELVGGGGTLEVAAAGSDTVSNLGAAATMTGALTASFSGFGNYAIDAGAHWTLIGGGILSTGQTLISASGGDVTLASGTLASAGTIKGASAGIILAGGLLANAGVVSGVYGVEDTSGGGATLSNTGAITGTKDSVLFRSVSDRLIVGAGAAFTGLAAGGGGALELAGGAGSISGLGGAGTLSGAASGKFSGFGAYVIDGDAAWTLASSGTLTSPKTLNVVAGGSLTVATGVTLTNSGTMQVSGALVNKGAIGGGSGGTVIDYGTITGSKDSVLFASAGDRLIAESGSVFTGQVVGGGGALELAAGVGTISNLGVATTLTGAVTASVTGFADYVLDAGGKWTLINGGALEFGQTVSVASGASLTLSNGTFSNAGAINGAAVGLAITGGSVTNTCTISGGVGAGGLGVSLGAGQLTNLGLHRRRGYCGRGRHLDQFRGDRGRQRLGAAPRQDRPSHRRGGGGVRRRGGGRRRDTGAWRRRRRDRRSRRRRDPNRRRQRDH